MSKIVLCVYIYLYAWFNEDSVGAIFLWRLIIDHGCIDVSPIQVGSPNWPLIGRPI